MFVHGKLHFYLTRKTPPYPIKTLHWDCFTGFMPTAVQSQSRSYISLCIYNAFCITLLVPAQVAVLHQMNNLYRRVAAITGLISSTGVGCVSLWELSGFPLDKSALTYDVRGAIFIPVWLGNYPEVMGCWGRKRKTAGGKCIRAACVCAFVWSLIDRCSTRSPFISRLFGIG